MLAKLLKYDFKAMFKIFLPLWGVLLVVSGINRLFSGAGLNAEEGLGLVNSLMVLLYVLLIMAVMVVTTVIIIARFYQGLLKDEGYLMFTIPVKPWQLVASKLISAVVISMLSVLVAIVSVLIIASYQGFFYDLTQVWEVLGTMTPNANGLAILSVVSVFVGLICAVSQVYASMALGHLAGSHRVGFAVLAFIVLSMAWSTVGTVIGLFGYPDVTTSLTTVTTQSDAVQVMTVFSDVMGAAGAGRGALCSPPDHHQLHPQPSAEPGVSATKREEP